MKKLVLALLATLVLLLAVVLIRAAPFGVAQGPVPAGAAERLAGAIRIPTVSHEDSARFDAAAFAAFHQLLATRKANRGGGAARRLRSGESLLRRSFLPLAHRISLRLCSRE